MKGAKEEEEWGSWRAPKPDLASKKLASTQKTHILQHINKATQP